MVPFLARTRRRYGIPPEWYSREYFLSDLCDGYREYLGGDGVSYVKRKLLAYVDPRPGDRVLEIGCGRGEVLRACAARGARATGIDYSQAAVRISAETCGAEARVTRADAAVLPFAAGSFDKVFLGDVLEHLTLAQARAMLAECGRVLAPGGRVVLHTSPNVLFIRLVFPWVMLGLLVGGRLALFRALAAQYRAIRRLHVREYSAGRLRRLLRASPFGEARVVCDPDLLRGGESRYTESLAGSGLIAAASRLLSREPLVRIFANDLWVLAGAGPRAE
ncbi:MAG: class I SAM-dependent methyltransferase [Candidatus Binatia bacterium]